MKHLNLVAASIALPLATFAQIFDLNDQLPTRMGGAQVNGVLNTQVNVATSEGTLGWVSSLSAGATPFSYFQTRTETTVVPQAFPLPALIYIEVFSGTFSISSPSPIATVSTGQQVPTYNSVLNGYTIPNTSAAGSIEISVSYSLISNGNPVASGSGAYTVSGTFNPVLGINTDGYPVHVGALVNNRQAQIFSPADNLPLVSITTAPSGRVYNVDKLSLAVGATAVPEPLHYGAAFSGCLMAFGIIRRKFSK
jgi:hypothetical protein